LSKGIKKTTLNFAFQITQRLYNAIFKRTLGVWFLGFNCKFPYLLGNSIAIFLGVLANLETQISAPKNSRTAKKQPYFNQTRIKVGFSFADF
jgi:hypothetical protein